MADEIKLVSENPVKIVHVVQRTRVVEYRVTTKLWVYTIRYWIESSPEHGGVASGQEARELVEKAENDVKHWYPMPSTLSLAEHLIEKVSCANSIEVCYHAGNGVTIHRDWP
jgi:hypothetical protein